MVEFLWTSQPNPSGWCFARIPNIFKNDKLIRRSFPSRSPFLFKIFFSLDFFLAICFWKTWKFKLIALSLMTSFCQMVGRIWYFLDQSTKNKGMVQKESKTFIDLWPRLLQVLKSEVQNYVSIRSIHQQRVPCLKPEGNPNDITNLCWFFSPSTVTIFVLFLGIFRILP